MNVFEWTVKAILQDSECCGNCIGCSKQFAQCSEVVVEDSFEK